MLQAVFSVAGAGCDFRDSSRMSPREEMKTTMAEPAMPTKNIASSKRMPKRAIDIRGV
jgi:hypothetical protein